MYLNQFEYICIRCSDDTSTFFWNWKTSSEVILRPNSNNFTPGLIKITTTDGVKLLFPITTTRLRKISVTTTSQKFKFNGNYMHPQLNVNYNGQT